MNQSNSSKQVLLSVIGVAILVVAVVGVSFAFFNYTRTGAPNTIRTGTITFTTSQETISLTNVFPVSKTVADTVPGTGSTPVTNPNVGLVTVTINGGTTYADGIDYRVSAQNVNFTASAISADGDHPATPAVALPVAVEVSANTALGTNVANGTFGNSAHQYRLYSYTGQTVLQTGDMLAEGHIATTQNSVTDMSNGQIYIKAYLDSSQVAITDTSVRESDPHIDNGTTNGTTTEWIGSRKVITTEQWNALGTTPLSFQVRVEAVEHEATNNWAQADPNTTHGAIVPAA